MSIDGQPLGWRQKVYAGQGFTPDEGFMRYIFSAHAKVLEFNDGGDSDLGQMLEKLRGLLGRLGQNSILLPRLTLDVGFNIDIGDETFINQNATFLDTYPIKIGNKVQIGPNCSFYPVGHPLRVDERWVSHPDGSHTNVTTGAPIVVEDQCWIGGNVVLLQGVYDRRSKRHRCWERRHEIHTSGCIRCRQSLPHSPADRQLN